MSAKRNVEEQDEGLLGKMAVWEFEIRGESSDYAGEYPGREAPFARA
jgi:hypothetical protein